ncbi:MAG: sigma-70 family RNA polymerase sigma factor [Coleofasciculaceae cyanobacterium]
MNQTQINELNEQLKQLALVAQQNPPLSPQRQFALRKLVNGILKSGKLCRPQSGQFSGAYQDIYDEALQELLLYICENIDKYNPERASVMAWVNVLLERRFFREAIPKILDKPNLKRMTLVDIERVALPEKSQNLTELIKEYIELDPENLFKTEYVVNHPEANFQALIKRRSAGKSWKEISAEFQIKTSTISSFYSRCLTKFSPKLREYCN